MNRIVQGWHFMRVLRLAVGAIIIWQSIAMKEWAPGIAGGFLLLLALANIGCCGPYGCSVPRRTPMSPVETKDGAEDVVFEEIKNNEPLKTINHE